MQVVVAALEESEADWFERRDEAAERVLTALKEAGYALVGRWSCCLHCGFCNVPGDHANPCDAGCSTPLRAVDAETTPARLQPPASGNAGSRRDDAQ